MRLHFAFIGEGPSDSGLIPHLEDLCIQLGADEVTGTPVSFERLDQTVTRTVEGKLRAALQLEPEADLIFLHRDADSRDPSPRHAEIEAAVATCLLTQRWVAVVPVQETEAWLLLDEALIRAVAGRPYSRDDLNLPSVHQVEHLANPKERLQAALVAAAGVRGRRLERFRRDFPKHRRLLLEGIATDGPIQHVPSWARMRNDLQRALNLTHGPALASSNSDDTESGNDATRS